MLQIHATGEDETHWRPTPKPEKPCDALVPVARFPYTSTLYPLPGAIETHELVVRKDGKGQDGKVTIFVTQQTSSRLLFLQFPKDNGICTFSTSWQIKQHTSGLHYVGVSQYIKDALLITLQFDSSIGYLDVSGGPLVKPEFLLEVFLPLPSKGPHRAFEHELDVWAGCKGIPGLIRVKDVIIEKRKGKYELNHVYNADSFTTYLVPANPIFESPMNGFVFATLDASNAIARVNPKLPPTSPDAVKIFKVPPEIGSTPVGMIEGYSPCQEGENPKGEVLWFVLAGAKSGGNGTFGKITGDGTITYFQTSGTFLETAGYLHLAWAPCSGEGYPKLLLMASSIAYPSPALRNPDGLAMVYFDKTYSTILASNFEFYPIQASKLHRIVASDMTFFVDALAGSTVQVSTTEHETQLGGATNQHSDYFSLFGEGANGTLVKYFNAFSGKLAADDASASH